MFTARNRLEHLVLTYADGVQRIYVQGRLVDATRFGGRLAGWDRKYPLVVGNEKTRDRPFLGDVSLVAVYDRALSASEVAAERGGGCSGALIRARRMPVPRPRWFLVGTLVALAASGVVDAGAATGPRVAVRDLAVDVDPGISGRFGGRVDVQVRFRVVNTATEPLRPTATVRVESQIGGGTASAPIRLPTIGVGARTPT